MELPENYQISTDSDTKGFDLSAGKTWIYPENYPIREYQFNIVQASLYSNTLVCLPTGLGKTFIAAVVMYNFWRWYPYGKVVFLAPTKPLVAQQIFACHNTMGIPSTETIELTGAINQKLRETAWMEKRVIFATPQVFHNDLEKNVVPDDSVKCVVIDEAHKALGKHSYCECIHILSEKNKNYRILALSATPGNKIGNVHEVLQNLHIAHVELRDESSLDIVPYINQRKIDIILVPLNKELAQYKERYITIMDRHVKVLLQHNVLCAQTANISKGRIFLLLKEFQKKTNRSGNYGQIIKTLTILTTMYHAYELMVRDGLRAFHKFYQNHSDKFWMNEEIQLQDLLDDIERYLGPFPDIKSIREGTALDATENFVFGHTKFGKLKELLLRHFTKSQEKNGDTRAIVFVEYRDIVSEVYILLSQCQPLIRPQMFVGQAGQKQKKQLEALENFRSNRVNVLVSTSIGEEGLDVGEVDLIICFDISQQSPTRLVQRMGRTGRKRDGHIIILVTDGREHETLKSTMARRDSLNNKILNTSNINSSLYQNNPRMIPDMFTPECLKMRINVQPKSPAKKGKNKKTKLDNKNNKRQNTAKKVTGTDLKLGSPRDDGKFSLIKFFKSDKRKEQDTLLTVGSNITENNSCTAIKSLDVKILSSDNDAVDFLTLCALRNSEKEINAEERPNAFKSYIPEFAPVKNFFNFSVPDIKILDCLISLNDNIPQSFETKHVDNNNDKASDSHDNDWYNSNCEFADMPEVIDDKDIIGESKFEDLLDDSNKSSEWEVLDTVSDTNVNTNGRSLPEASIPSERCPDIDVSNVTMKGIQALEDLQPGMFEDILNESSDDSESNTYIESPKKEMWTGNNGVQEDLPKRTFHREQNFENCMREGKNNLSSCRESKNQSMFSITQAINEIARFNSRSNVSRVIEESEDDMFLDEIQLESEKNSDQERRDLNRAKNQSNDAKDPNGRRNFDDAKTKVDTDLKFEDYDWNDDFEVTVDPVESCYKFGASKGKTGKSEVGESDLKTRYFDSEDWISAEKSLNASKANVTPGISIAKKLASVKKRFSDKRNFGDGRNLYGKSHGVSSKRERDDPEEATENSNDRRKRKRVRVKVNEFIDDEAVVSAGDSGDESSESDADLHDFVSYTQDVHNTTDMQVHYMQAVRSPIKRQNVFLLKEPQAALDPDIEIYSQAVSQEDSYMNDSFCVEEGEEEEPTRVAELSILEQAERELERRKRKRVRRDKAEDGAGGRTKPNRRRNILNDCSSSEDETTEMWKQIREESFLLAQSKR